MTLINTATGLTALTLLSKTAASRSEGVSSSSSGHQIAPVIALGVNPHNKAAAEIVRIVLAMGNTGYETSASDAQVQGSKGDDYIRVYGDHATIDGGDGNDDIGTYAYADVSGGAGNDAISTHANATVSGGDGDDRIATYGYSTVTAGNGDDRVYGYSHMTVDAGDGNDWIHVMDHATVDAGAGNDEIAAMGGSNIKAGDGDDEVVVSSDGNGLGVYGGESVDGGAGNDYIQVGANADVTGGTGNDKIRLTEAGSTVNFAKGDGQDTILSRDSFTLKIGGYSKDQMVVDDRGDTMVISFKGSTDSMTLDMSKGMTVHVDFENGDKADLAASTQNWNKTMLTASANVQGHGGAIWTETDALTERQSMVQNRYNW